MRIPKSRGWLIILVITSILMFATGAAYAISPEIISVHGTITVAIPEFDYDEMNFPDWSLLPPGFGGGQVLGDGEDLYDEDEDEEEDRDEDKYDNGYHDNDYEENEKNNEGGYSEDGDGSGHEIEESEVYYLN